MKSKKDTSTPATTRKPATPLKLTPEQAEREAAKLRDLRDDLETNKGEQDTSIRSSPLGRDN